MVTNWTLQFRGVAFVLFATQSPTALTLQTTANHQSAETREQVSNFALHFQVQWHFFPRFGISSSFLREAPCVDVDSHSAASLSAVFFVTYMLRDLLCFSCVHS